VRASYYRRSSMKPNDWKTTALCAGEHIHAGRSQGLTMKRTGFTRKAPPPRPAKQYEGTKGPQPRACARPEVVARLVVPVPKLKPIQHEGYMAAVRRLRCYRCGIVGFTQFCHSDEGKGIGIKTDCREGWPGCGPHFDASGVMVNGCHHYVGTSGSMPRAEKRQFEDDASRDTRAQIRACGLWPEGLELWPEDEEITATEAA